jgi:hypothetical protein
VLAKPEEKFLIFKSHERRYQTPKEVIPEINSRKLIVVDKSDREITKKRLRPQCLKDKEEKLVK